MFEGLGIHPLQDIKLRLDSCRILQEGRPVLLQHHPATPQLAVRAVRETVYSVQKRLGQPEVAERLFLETYIGHTQEKILMHT